ncbi:MAG: PKD domain-containing protein, partial [Calditrichaeota bacterium]
MQKITFYRILFTGLLLCFLPVLLVGQTAEMQYHYQNYTWKSEKFNGNDTPAGQAAISHTITITDAPWLRLYFKNANLGTRSYLTITSLKDGHTQKIDHDALQSWKYSSAYFNGNAVELKLFVDPADRDVSFEIEEVTVGDWVGGTPLPESICDVNDDRVPSTNPRTGRLVPVGCTGWIIDNGKYLTAGHCLSGGSAQTFQFNVPNSLPDGTLQHPGPEDQYTVISSSLQYTDGGVGNDWGVYEVEDNAQTGLQPIDAMGASFTLAQDLGPANIRITGYGVDNDDLDLTQTQQTHVGPSAGSSGTTMRYRTDTTGGNSGSPVIDEATGNAVGIHTHGGCGSGGSGNNSGTSTFHTDFWAAVNTTTCDVTADFSANTTSGAAPLTVNFTDETTGPATSWSWNFGDGNTSTTQNPSHTYTADGNYTVSLTATSATCSDSETKTSYISVSTPNQAPTAIINSPTNGQNFASGATVNFSGSATDTDGTVAVSTYEWTVNGPGVPVNYVFASGVANPSGVPPADGNYTVTLEVTDNDGATGTVSVNFTVGGTANQPPTAVASANPTSGTAPLAVNFSSSGSSDSDGSITSYNWNFGDGNSSSAANPSHTYNSTGNYNAVLTVTDNDGATGTDQVTINVTGTSNQPPTAVASANPTSGTAPLAVNFSSSGSSDSDGSITSYSWNFGDGNSSSAANPSHTYNSTGNYNAVLTVTDNDGATGTDQVTINVTAPANQPPTATINTPANGQSFSVGAVISYSGSGSDSDGSVTGYSWTYSRNGANPVTFSSSASGSAVGSASGTYVLTLTVTDNDGATGTDQVTITIGSGKAVGKGGIVDGANGFTSMFNGYELGDAYPNPFNPETKFTFSLGANERVTLKIYNAIGQEVRTLINGAQMNTGAHTMRWDAKNNLGDQVPSGIY